MKEFDTILSAFDKIDFSSRKAALATVVQVKGSSYRSPGARMLMQDNGQWVGSISGGCLEGDALRKSRQVIMSDTPRTVTYDTSNDDDNQLGIGLGCNGIIDILIEPINPDKTNNPITRLRKIADYANLGCLATVFESDTTSVSIGNKVGLSPEGLYDSDNKQLQGLISQDLVKTVDNRRSTIKKFKINSKSITVFFEVIEPNIDILIFGGGFDAKPVTTLAKALGWNVRVSDECVAHLIPINFPNADNMQPCKRERVADEVKITPFTAVVLMSHNLKYDIAVMQQVYNSPAPYIGILGPKKRADKIFDALHEEHHITLSKEVMNKIHAPIGLDIGAETPDEIALSIISEIQAKFANRSGGFIKYRTGPIHHKDGKEDQVFKQVYLKHCFPKKAISNK